MVTRAPVRQAAGEEAEREKAREERRTVIANNKAWKAATTVRREWLAGLLTRRLHPRQRPKP